MILHLEKIMGGTLKTFEYCKIHNKPFIKINLLDDFIEIQVNFINWIKENRIAILNVAGPRESEETVYTKTVLFLMELL